ncbi:hypothetical protein SISNIDRAFT_470624 [Sistotremastrum niveocremeum HHB9708]|uniref:Uncharacterized protein n=1 Tax=Sistotremastrum niveocremeum HHB9708 TaxID=1314777 RepID=A0A164NNJ8_9AGAM|nr:hypothetical protein SISNIDRAFT_470624 [Sistotremastrum niveocremeum HHB9708]
MAASFHESLDSTCTPAHCPPSNLPPFSAISQPSSIATIPDSSIRTARPHLVLPPVHTVREKRLAREEEEKRRKRGENRTARQKKADEKYHDNVREALENLKDTLSEGPAELPTTISEVYIAAGQASLKLFRQCDKYEQDHEDWLTGWAGGPPCKAKTERFTTSDSEDSEDRPSETRWCSDRAYGPKVQRQAEKKYREHRSDALRWLRRVVFWGPSSHSVCEVIKQANDDIRYYRETLRGRGDIPVA